jgi:hypothetical protein
MKMQKITMQDVLEKAQEFIENGKLGVCAGKTNCEYDYGDGCRCVIGSVMTEETLAHIKERGKNSYGIYNIAISEPLEDVVEFPSSDSQEFADMTNLQDAHDLACMHCDSDISNKERDKFFMLFGEMKQKYATR